MALGSPGGRPRHPPSLGDGADSETTATHPRDIDVHRGRRGFNAESNRFGSLPGPSVRSANCALDVGCTLVTPWSTGPRPVESGLPALASWRPDGAQSATTVLAPTSWPIRSPGTSVLFAPW